MQAKSKVENPLFDITASHHGGNPESAEANRRIASSKSETRNAIYAWALTQKSFGITADECAQAFSCSHNHVAPRITELRALKLLVPTDRKRKTRTGSLARVLVAVQKEL
jgi:hypothetical protein